ncbi:hypothetical protein D3C84_556350 [compost metagenome]
MQVFYPAGELGWLIRGETLAGQWVNLFRPGLAVLVVVDDHRPGRCALDLLHARKVAGNAPGQLADVELSGRSGRAVQAFQGRVDRQDRAADGQQHDQQGGDQAR